MSSALNDLAARYIEVWNEPDAGARRTAIAELFAADAEHYTPTREVRGRAELAERIGGAYQQWVEPGAHFFRSAGDATGHHSAVRFHWEMVVRATGEVVSVGFDFLLLDDDGRIRSDHQFVD